MAVVNSFPKSTVILWVSDVSVHVALFVNCMICGLIEETYYYLLHRYVMLTRCQFSPAGYSGEFSREICPRSWEAYRVYAWLESYRSSQFHDGNVVAEGQGIIVPVHDHFLNSDDHRLRFVPRKS